MDFPKRKGIRLKNYDYSQNGAYFITICTQNRSRTLSQIVGDGFPVPVLTHKGVIVQEQINEIPLKYIGVKIDKYVIMPNHIHIILISNDRTRNPSPTIATIIGWLKYQITKQINLHDKTTGLQRFQRSYHDRIIRNEKEYQKIWEYIETNPLHWKDDCFYLA